MDRCERGGPVTGPHGVMISDGADRLAPGAVTQEPLATADEVTAGFILSTHQPVPIRL